MRKAVFRAAQECLGKPGRFNPVSALVQQYRNKWLIISGYVNISFRDERGKRKLTPEDTLALHQQSRAWLQEELNKPFAGPTVVITHHAPHPNSLLPGSEGDILSTAYVSDLSGLMGKAQLWIHGHTHSSRDYEVDGTRVVCNPRGYYRISRI